MKARINSSMNIMNMNKFYITEGYQGKSLGVQ